MVEGMDTVVATVTGYHGTQRSQVVRLITLAGANYVGKMSKSTTHLICWKFRGEKYELAKKFGTKVVNHRWFEDCIKEGKRIPERSFERVSGQDAGFIMSDLSLVLQQVHSLKENKSLLKKRSMPDFLTDVIDLDSDEIENDDGFLLDKDLFPVPRTITTERPRSKRKLVKETSRGNWQAKADDIRSNDDADAHTTDMFQSEQSDRLLNRSNEQRNPDMSTRVDLAESSHRHRRLVKKNPESGTTRLATDDTKLQNKIPLDSNDVPTASNLSNNSNGLREAIGVSISSGHVTSSANGTSNHGINHINDIDPPRDAGVQCNNLPEADGRNVHENSPNCQILEVQHENKDPHEHFTRLQTSAELSCVICLADFCSTRGVLPCGHRFCFSCIQNWADYRASNRKETTCPLCKASFASITRIDGAASLDQQIYSQTVPCPQSSQDIFFVPEVAAIRSNTQIPVSSACCYCQSPYPVELLRHCQICQISCVHSYCLDPPLFPWTCSSCRDRRLFYQY
ncbi:hypothetical protein vseg_006739 [Gypsophila vaccaria]